MRPLNITESESENPKGAIIVTVSYEESRKSDTPRNWNDQTPDQRENSIVRRYGELIDKSWEELVQSGERNFFVNVSVHTERAGWKWIRSNKTDRSEIRTKKDYIDLVIGRAMDGEEYDDPEALADSELEGLGVQFFAW